jgi:hypothetical protein
MCAHAMSLPSPPIIDGLYKAACTDLYWANQAFELRFVIGFTIAFGCPLYLPSFNMFQAFFAILQPVLDIKEILEDARLAPTMPVQIWDNSDFLDDHQFHGMDDEELQEFFDNAKNVPTSEIRSQGVFVM